MAMEFNILLLFPLFLVAALFLLLPATKSKKTPPSPPKLPLIGNLHQLGSLPHRSLRRLSEKHGPLMLLHIFRTPTLVVSSPEIALEIMKTHDLSLANRPFSHASESLFYGNKDIIFSPYGDYWRLLRKICVLELLSAKKVKSFQLVREEEVGCLIDQLISSSSAAAAADLRHLLHQLTNDIVSRIALGKKYTGDEKTEGDDGIQLLDVVREYSPLVASYCMRDHFPSLGWVDYVTGLEGRLRKVSRKMDAFLDRVIEQHRAKKQKAEADGAGDAGEDFVDVLVRLQEESELGFELDGDSIKAIVLDVFNAGTETAASTMEWAMAELMKNPRVMAKAQEEVRRVARRKEKVEEGDLQQMHYLKWVIKESLRLHPIAPLLVPRESSGEFVMQGYRFPAKTRVMVNAWAIARDPRFWERPEEFLPERFDGNPVDFRGQDFHFLPFGGGRRICPGISFAVPTVELALANLLYFFDWEMAGGWNAEELDMSEVAGVTVCLKSPLRLIPIRRFSD